MPTGSADRASHVSRRSFIQGGVVLASAGVATSCAPADPGEREAYHGDISAPDRTPHPPPRTPMPGVYEFFTSDEARRVEAIVARIIPGEPDDPGAVDAGVVTYIDGKLARFEAFAEPTYLGGPFPEPYTGDEPPGPDTDEVIYVAEAELYRYGMQSDMSPQDLYRNGLAALDGYAEQRFGAPFTDLSDEQQDALLEVLDAVAQRSEDPEALEEGGPALDGENGGPPPEELDAAEEAFGEVDPGSFFDTVREDTIDGMFADPMYGGNRGLVGWQMIGYPGVQRSYSPIEMKEGTAKQPQAMDGLHPMSPDRPDEHAPGAIEQPREGVVEG